MILDTADRISDAPSGALSIEKMAHAQKSAKGAVVGGKATSKGKRLPAGGKKTEDEREETLQAVV